MSHFISPWITQLARTRPLATAAHTESHIVIVGGGIAGISTAYFLLTHTDSSIVLCEAGKVAHGATGHNAGQVVSYFERSFGELVKEFGLPAVAEAEQLVHSGWEIIDEMITRMNITTPLQQFIGYAGLSSEAQIILHLENSILRKEAGLVFQPILIRDDHSLVLDEKYTGLYSLVSKEKLFSLLEVTDERYLAVLQSKKGCMNSARFTEEVATYLLTHFHDRFALSEETPVHTIELYEGHAVVHTNKQSITTETVILCTNGFEHFTIKNMMGEDIDTRFHHLVSGEIGYMAGYTEDEKKAAIAISYFEEQGTHWSNPYVYMTRRPHTQEQQLLCIGGPVTSIPDTSSYISSLPYPESVAEHFDMFMHTTYTHTAPLKKAFMWHGLMGYTPNGVRLIGREPRHPHLLYNLGCNGIGILPSLYGAKRISQILSGVPLTPTLFDPK